MSANPFVKKEIDKLFNENTESPKNYALACAWIIANFKGVNLKIFDVNESSSLCDYNIIASAQNPTQARTMIEEIQNNLKRHGASVLSVEGLQDGEWILCDLGDVIVHIFQEVARDIFDLDDLWSNYPQIQIPQEYYFNASNSDSSDEDSTENYF
jgi:ribosome-associated protein